MGTERLFEALTVLSMHATAHNQSVKHPMCEKGRIQPQKDFSGSGSDRPKKVPAPDPRQRIRTMTTDLVCDSPVHSHAVCREH
jgi:hypothetical protein